MTDRGYCWLEYSGDETGMKLIAKRVQVRPTSMDIHTHVAVMVQPYETLDS